MYLAFLGAHFSIHSVQLGRIIVGSKKIFTPVNMNFVVIWITIFNVPG